MAYCIFDNPATHCRETWSDDRLIASVSLELISQPDAVKRLWPAWLREVAAASFISGHIEGDSTAMQFSNSAEPEPEPPTDEDLLNLDQLRDRWNAQADAFNTWDELGIDEIVWWAQRQALARWGNHPGSPDSPLQPIPVSERLPEPKDCDNGRNCRVWCWSWDIGAWTLSRIDYVTHSHWLPAHVLPVPS